MIDISRTPPLTETTARDGRLPQAAQTLGDLHLKLHQAVLAEVTATVAISAEERQHLLADKMASNLPQAVRAAWLALLSSASLQLATLKIDGRVVQALTNQLLTAGQTISISLDSNGQLRLRLDLPRNTSVPGAHSTAPPTSVPSHPAPGPTRPGGLHTQGSYPPAVAVFSQTAGVSSVFKGTASDTSSLAPVARFHQDLEQQLTSALSEIVRRTLPLAQPPGRLLACAQDVLRQVDPEALTADSKLATVLTNLSRLIDLTPRWDRWQQAPIPSLKSALQTFSSAAPAEQNDTTGQQVNYPALLQALKALLISPATVGSQPAGPEVDGWEKALWSLLKQHPESGRAEAERNRTTPLLQLLKESLEGAVARQELQQSRHLLSQTLSGTTSHPVQVADIPLRFGDLWFGNVHLQIHEQRERGGSKHSRSKKRCSKWTAYLELGLNDEQGLAVEVALTESRVEATLWCSGQQIHQHTQEKLGELRAVLEEEGLEVVDLRCLASRPPSRESQVAVSLIDVRT